jgi:glycine cleavage system H lipoate-binding protein
MEGDVVKTNQDAIKQLPAIDCSERYGESWFLL